MQAVETSKVRQHLEHWHRSHGGAVRVGNNALGRVLRRVWVHFGHYQWDLSVLAVGGRVIHHGCTRCSKDWRPLLGGRTTRGEQCNINVGDGLFRDLGEVFNNNLVPTEF